MKSLTSDEIRLNTFWLKHVFFRLALDTDATAARVSNEDILKKLYYVLYKECEERQFRLLDKELSVLSNTDDVRFEYKDEAGQFRWVKITPKFVVEALAWMCKTVENYWDESKASKYEIEYFKKSIFGKALWEFECFTSQVSQISQVNNDTIRYDAENNPQTVQTRSSSSSSSSHRGSNPNNSFRSRGALSSSATALISKPGVKEILNGSNVWKIVDDGAKVKTKETRVLIRPLNAKYQIGNTNKVFISHSNNFGDMTCFFETRQAAEDFINKVYSSTQYAGKLTPSSKKTDPNGYYRIGTELGECLVRAKDLNEQVWNEDVEQENTTENIFEEYYNFVN